MLSARVPIRAKARLYWQDRVDEADDALSKASTTELRALYADLLRHYERMAALVGAAPPRPTLVNLANHRPKYTDLVTFTPFEISFFLDHYGKTNFKYLVVPRSRLDRSSHACGRRRSENEARS